MIIFYILSNRKYTLWICKEQHERNDFFSAWMSGSVGGISSQHWGMCHQLDSISNKGSVVTWNSIWLETGALPWRVVCAKKYWLFGTMAYAVCHCFKPNAVSSHRASLVRSIACTNCTLLILDWFSVLALLMRISCSKCCSSNSATKYFRSFYQSNKLVVGFFAAGVDVPTAETLFWRSPTLKLYHSTFLSHL